MESNLFLLYFLLLLLTFHPNPSFSEIGNDREFFDPTRVTQLSWHPRAFLYHGFLSDQECDHLIELAKDKLEKSMVADNESGKSVMSEVRTSSGMFLDKKQDEVVDRIESRIAAWTFLPEENGESIQILHYEHGQKYEPHFDYFHDKTNVQLGGHRIATVLMYLSSVEKGGETVFPNAEGKLSQPKDDTWSDCAKKGYAVKPQKGDALLFFSLHLDATTDTLSLHGSCPVIEGEKWSATKWIHVRSFDRSESTESGDGCTDDNALCSHWAALGECKKNPLYMVGGKGSRGYCRKSCRVCEQKKMRSNLISVLLLLVIASSATASSSFISPLKSDNDESNQCVYTIYIRTGTIWKAGTDSIISLTLATADGYGIKITDLVAWGGLMGPDYDYFERGNLDIFSGRGPCLSDTPCWMNLTSDGSGPHHGWYTNYVEVTSTGPHMGCGQKQFTVEQWLATDAAPYELFAVRDECPKAQPESVAPHESRALRAGA